MTRGSDEYGKPRPKSRLEAFSDGVFAIAITLLALEIGVPEGSGDDLAQAILDQWPSYLAYLVSFATIGAVWLKHSAITDLMPQTDGVFLRINLALLLFVVFLPFPTRLVAEYIDGSESAERTAVVFLTLNILLISVLLGALWQYARRRKLIDERIDEDEAQYLTAQITPSLGVYAAAVVLGLVVPKLTVVLLLVAAILLAFPARTMLRWLPGRGRR